MTFSVLVAVPERALLGVACASRSLGVGASVPAVLPGVGVVASQAWTNPGLRGRVLDALAAGDGPERALARLPEMDEGHTWRQVGVLAADGAGESYTGTECSHWAGARTARPSWGAVLALGNLLTGQGVLEALVEAVCARAPRSPGDLGAALLDGLAAGQEAGGDRRGRQSAGLLVGSGAGQSHRPPTLDLDLRVDDHPAPLAEARRLLALRRADPALRPRTG